MIALLLTYLLFQIAFDHWGSNSVEWRVVYFAFQYGWVAIVAGYQWYISRQFIYGCFALIFIAVSVNELIYFHVDATTYEQMSSKPPAIALTIIAALIFVCYEILKKWKRNLA